MTERESQKKKNGGRKREKWPTGLDAFGAPAPPEKSKEGAIEGVRGLSEWPNKKKKIPI